MPLGQGYLPSGAIGNQLSYITRRAVLPRMVSQIYNASPLAVALLMNAEREAGGVDSVIANVQSGQLVQPQYTSFQGSFTAPTAVQGIQPASWSMCEAVIPIPLFISEMAIQEKQAIQSILDARFTDAGNAARDMFANTFYNNTTNVLAPLGLPAAIDDGTVVNSYGGITRSSNTFWQSKRYSAGSAPLTRTLALQYIVGVTKAQGEAPTFGITGPGTWYNLANDFMGLERYIPNQEKTDEYLSAFRALEVANVPIYFDAYAPEGTLWLINTNYLGLRIHEMFEWEFTGFESMIPGLQLSYVGCVICMLTLVNTKPKANAIINNLTFPTI